MSTFHTRRELPHPPEQVWRALTDADLLGRWFMRSDTDLAPDARFELNDPQARGWSGRLRCEVQTFAPYEVLRYRAEEVGGSSSTILTWTLTPAGTGTTLALEHAGWSGMRGWLTGMALKLGWAALLKKQLPEVLRDLALDR